MAHRIDTSAADIGLIQAAPCAIIGYGSQGRAQALNLRDSAVQVLVGARPGPSWDRAVADGFAPVPLREAVEQAGLAMLTLPDEHMGDVYRQDIAPFLPPSPTLLFSHGFAIRFGQITPPTDADVILAAPKGQARGVRDRYLAGSGVPALLGVHQDASGRALAKGLSYAKACGYTRSLVLEATFAAEAETDLFGEQTVLCGGMIELMKAGFQVLVEAGYDPDLAYFECVHETKLIVDLLVERGLKSTREAISDTAEWGGYQVGPQLVTEETRSTMRAALARIQSGEFAAEWVAEARDGKHKLREFRNNEAASGVQKASDSLLPQLESQQQL